MWHQFIFIQLLTIFCEKLYAQYDSPGLVVGNLRRRESIPLYQLSRRYMIDNDDDLSYRRTKDIRDLKSMRDRRFEMTEALLREAKIAENMEELEKLNREARWLSIDNEDGINIG